MIAWHEAENTELFFNRKPYESRHFSFPALTHGQRVPKLRFLKIEIDGKPF